MNRLESIEFATKLLDHDVVIYGQKVGVMRDDDEEGSLHIPDTAKRKPIRGRVVGIGRGVDTADKEDQLAGMMIGDWVFFTKYNPVLFDIPFDDGIVELEVMSSADIHMGIRDVPK